MTSYFKQLGWVFLCGLIGACSALQGVVEKPTVHVQSVQYHSISLEQGRLDTSMTLHNPNTFGLPVRKVNYHLKLNDRDLLNSALSFDKTIPANGTIEIQWPMQFRYSDILNGITSILQQKRIHFQLSGDIDFGLVNIPFSKSGDFALVR